MSNETKIKNLLNAIKLEVDDIQKFEKDVDSIIGMFDQLKEVNVENIESNLHRKKVTINDLRTDESKDANFRPELRGKYFTVPNVSKKK